MRRKPLLALVAGLTVAAVVPVASFAGGEIYGTIYTDSGDTYTGAIRWDKNENFWDDVLDARKDREVTVKRGRRDVRIFGLRISKQGDTHSMRSQLSIPFGEIRAITALGRKQAELTLRNGETITVHESSDIGRNMRGLTVDDRNQGEVDLDWKSVDRIEFEAGPGAGRDEDRLYGTVETRSAKFTGFIVWDKDESLRSDILDGEDDGHRYKIPFRKIESIRKHGKDASEVALAAGRTVVLEGTNDVDSDNRGIVVTIPGIGLVEIQWDVFRRITFSAAPPSVGYDQFDGGHKLYGTLTTKTGETHEGEIVWDNDEEYTWEPLDGELAGVEFSIPFKHIESITPVSRHAAKVVLRNGDVYTLEGSNDVNKENKGVRVTSADGEEVELEWEDLASITFGN